MNPADRKYRCRRLPRPAHAIAMTRYLSPGRINTGTALQSLLFPYQTGRKRPRACRPGRLPLSLRWPELHPRLQRRTSAKPSLGSGIYHPGLSIFHRDDDRPVPVCGPGVFRIYRFFSVRESEMTSTAIFSGLNSLSGTAYSYSKGDRFNSVPGTISKAGTG